jgi:hypothetical protein
MNAHHYQRGWVKETPEFVRTKQGVLYPEAHKPAIQFFQPYPGLCPEVEMKVHFFRISHALLSFLVDR